MLLINCIIWSVKMQQATYHSYKLHKMFWVLPCHFLKAQGMRFMEMESRKWIQPSSSSSSSSPPVWLHRLWEHSPISSFFANRPLIRGRLSASVFLQAYWSKQDSHNHSIVECMWISLKWMKHIYIPWSSYGSSFGFACSGIVRSSLFALRGCNGQLWGHLPG